MNDASGAAPSFRPPSARPGRPSSRPATPAGPCRRSSRARGGRLRQGRLEQLAHHAEGEVALELAAARAQRPRPRRVGHGARGADERRLADARRALDHQQAAAAVLRPRHRRLDARQLRVALEDVRAGPRRVAHYATAIAPGSPSTRRPITAPAARRRARDRPRRAARPTSSRRTRAARATAPRRRRRTRSRPRTRGCGGCRPTAARSSSSTARDALERRDGAGLDRAATPLSRARPCRCPSRPKPVTSVMAEAPGRDRRRARLVVERRHDRHRARQQRVVGLPALARGHHRAGAQRLGQHQHVADAAARVGDHAVGVHGAGDGQAVLRLGVVDRMAADDLGAGRAHDVEAAAQHLAQRGRAELLERPRHQVERGQRPAAHRVDVGQRVGRGDAPEVVGVVDDRREEVDGLHQRELVGDPPRRPRRRRSPSPRAARARWPRAGRGRSAAARRPAACIRTRRRARAR